MFDDEINEMIDDIYVGKYAMRTFKDSIDENSEDELDEDSEDELDEWEYEEWSDNDWDCLHEEDAMLSVKEAKAKVEELQKALDKSEKEMAYWGCFEDVYGDEAECEFEWWKDECDMLNELLHDAKRNYERALSMKIDGDDDK